MRARTHSCVIKWATLLKESRDKLRKIRLSKTLKRVSQRFPTRYIKNVSLFVDDFFQVGPLLKPPLPLAPPLFPAGCPPIFPAALVKVRKSAIEASR